MKTFLHLFILTTLFLILPRGAVFATTTKQAAPPASKSQEDAGLDLIIKAIRKFKLTSLKIECLSFLEGEKIPGGKLAIAEVREKHDAKCGGDPNVMPRLFEIRVNQETGEVWVDTDSEGLPSPDFRSLGKL